MAITRTRRSWDQTQVDRLRRDVIAHMSLGYTKDRAFKIVGKQWGLSHYTVSFAWYGVGVTFSKYRKAKYATIPVPHPAIRKELKGLVKVVDKLESRAVTVSAPVAVEEVDIKTLMRDLKKKYGLTSITF